MKSNRGMMFSNRYSHRNIPERTTQGGKPEDIAAVTDLLQDAINERNHQGCVDALVDLLRLCKSRTDESHWKKPRNHVSDKLLRIVRRLLVDRDRQVRIQAARALRYLMWDKSVLRQMVKLNIPIFICRCLERDQQQKSLWERMQALKWIRAAKDLEPQKIPRCCVVALVAIAACQKEEFRRACLLTLREIADVSPAIVAGCGGIRCLVDGTLDPVLSDMGPNLTDTLLKILDTPETRVYLRAKTDVQRLLWNFGDCESSGYGHSSDPQMKAMAVAALKEKTNAQEAAEKTLYRLLSSSTGLIYLAGEGAHGGIKGLCDILALPPSVKSVSWAKGALYRVFGDMLTPWLLNSKPIDQRGPNLMASFVALALGACIENGLVEALVRGGLQDQAKDPKNTMKARNLLARLQELGGRYLPREMCTKIATIPLVVNTASIFGKSVAQGGLRLTNLQTSVKRNWAAAMVTELANADTYQTHGVQNVTKIVTARNWDVMKLAFATDLNSSIIRYRHLCDPEAIVAIDHQHLPYTAHRDSDANWNCMEPSIGYLRAMPGSFIKSREKSYSRTSQKNAILERMRHQRDEEYSPEVMQNILKNTGVNLYKDHTSWKYQKLWQLLNGPLWHENHFRIASGTRFIKRICNWIQPSRGNFQKKEWKVENMHYARVACQVFRVMTSSEETCRNVHFRATVTDIFNCFKEQLSANENGNSTTRKYSGTLSSENVWTTLSRTYFVLIGILSESNIGLSIFQELKFVEELCSCVRNDIINLGKGYTNSPNDYLIRQLAVKLDYTHSNADITRMVFTVWIEQGSQNLRRYLINHLNVLFRSQCHGRVFRLWAINLLVMQLNKQTNSELSLTALRVLETASCRVTDPYMDEHIREIIGSRPSPDVVGRQGDNLFIKLLSQEAGYKYLQMCGNWLNHQRDRWLEEKNETYVTDMEKALAKASKATMLGSRVMWNESKEESAPETLDEEKVEEVPDNYQQDHLVSEHYSEQEEYYYELLSELPWSIRLTISSPGVSTMHIPIDCFFDYTVFYPKSHSSELPRLLGPGCVGVCLNLPSQRPQPQPLTPGCTIKMKLSCGKNQLDVLPNIIERSAQYTGKEPSYNGKDTIIQKQGMTLFLKTDRSKDDHSLVQVVFHVPIIQTNYSIVRPLPHFFGELAATSEGCNFIKSKGDIGRLAKVIKSAMAGKLKSSNNLELRASIWAFGMIASSESGLNLLLETDPSLLTEMTTLAYSSPTLSIRVSCFLAIGMIARTEAGERALQNLEYQFPVDNLELDLAIAIPSDLKRFFSLPSDKEYKGSWALDEKNCFNVSSSPKLSKPAALKKDTSDPLADTKCLEETILAHIAALACNVTQKHSCEALRKIKSKKAALFESPVLFREVCKLTNAYQFKLPARRFITFNLFDRIQWGNMQAFDVSMDTPIKAVSKPNVTLNRTGKSVRRVAKPPHMVGRKTSSKKQPKIPQPPALPPEVIVKPHDAQSDSHENDHYSSSAASLSKRGNLSPSEEGPTPLFDANEPEISNDKGDEPPSPHHPGYKTEYGDRFKYRI